MDNMSIKPILFNTDMVRAILDGRKTVTRRVVKPRYVDGDAGFNVVTNAHTGESFYIEYYDEDESTTDRRMKPPYLPDDVLWVRETWAQVNESIGMDLKTKKIIYRANYSDIEAEGWKWRPSIHMPREAARIFLRVTDVRVERLQEITDDGAKAEGANNAVGVSDKMRESAIRRFQRIWDSTIKPTDREEYGWDANPWVWCICFERCERPEGWPCRGEAEE